MRVLAVAVLIVCSMAYGTRAFDFQCSEFRPMLQDRQLERPEKPYCASSYLAFSDSYEFDNCRREMDQFKSRLQKYLSCLESESKEAVSEYNDAVSSFNRRAQQ